MDKARIAIVPADETNLSARDLKVVFFDRTILKIKEDLVIQCAQLNGYQLKFKNDNCHGIDLCEVYPGVGLGVVQRRRPAKRLVIDVCFFSFFSLSIT